MEEDQYQCTPAAEYQFSDHIAYQVVEILNVSHKYTVNSLVCLAWAKY